MKPVLAVLGQGVIPADTPFIRADDLGLTRGDGIFSTVHVRDGSPWLLDRHLARMADSASRMDFALPPLEGLATEACAAWDSDQEGALKIVATRGVDGSGVPTCFATVNPVSPTSIGFRSSGVRVITLSYGYPAHARTEAPWLLGGVKSLSYAVNMASLRHAQSLDADDALWISSDGYALEAPTASLVWERDGVFYTVPSATTGILPGITARYLFEHVESATAMVRPSELDSAWLLSSIRGIAEIRHLDGRPLGPSVHTGRLRSILGF